MFALLLAAATLPQGDARALIEWQLRSPPRTEEQAGLSAPEAETVRSLYLQSIGQRPPQRQDESPSAP
jgi:hypothetical protein